MNSNTSTRYAVALDGISVVRPSVPTQQISQVHGVSRPIRKPKAAKRLVKFRRPSLKAVVTNVSILLLLTAAEAIPALQKRPFTVALVYVGLAIILRISSQKTFGIALIFLILIPLLYAADLKPLADIYAIFAYLFLVIGTGTAFVEHRL